MGGGKTHSMLALGLLARNPRLYDKVPSQITAGLPGEQSKVVAIHGRSVSRDKFIWGEIAEQLGKGSEFAEFWKNGPEAPTETDWMKLLGDPLRPAQTSIMLMLRWSVSPDAARTRPDWTGH